MGCISSKVMCRSMSFQEELNQRFQKTDNSNSIPMLEELIISSNGSDQLLALVCTANTVANKLRSGSFTSESNTCPKPAIEPANSLEQGVEKQMQPAAPLLLPPPPKVMGSIDVNLAKRSKSCHWLPEHDVSFLPLESFDGAKEDRYEWSNRAMVRARSIRTVEEYDAMVEKIWLSRAQQTGCNGQDDDSATIVQLRHSKSLSDMSHHVEDEKPGFQEMYQSRLKDKASVKENTAIEEPDILFSSGLETKEVIPSPNSSSTTKELDVGEDAAQDGNIFENNEKGFKRKAIAKGLESLRISPTIEFPSIAILREWLHVGGQVYSPGAYVTPKFGSYSLPISGTANQCSEGVVFNPELVAAIEESMQQLEEEEERILKQMSENLEEESTNEKQTVEENPSHTKV